MLFFKLVKISSPWALKEIGRTRYCVNQERGADFAPFLPANPWWFACPRKRFFLDFLFCVNLLELELICQGKHVSFSCDICAKSGDILQRKDPSFSVQLFRISFALKAPFGWWKSSSTCMYFTTFDGAESIKSLTFYDNQLSAGQKKMMIKVFKRPRDLLSVYMKMHFRISVLFLSLRGEQGFQGLTLVHYSHNGD